MVQRAAKPPLNPQQRRAAIMAGAIAGGLFGIGWGILGIVAIFLLVVVAFGAVMALLFGGVDVTGGLGAIFIGILLVAFLIGVALVIISVVVSRSILRKGGVHRSTAVTWVSLLIVLVLNSIAGRIADPFITGGGGGADVPVATRVIAGLAMLIVAVGAGVGAWLLMAHAFRAPAGTVVDPAAGEVPVAPVSPPEPPAKTVTPPPLAPPTAPGG